jgi:hypothetical protein
MSVIVSMARPAAGSQVQQSRESDRDAAEVCQPEAGCEQLEGRAKPDAEEGQSIGGWIEGRISDQLDVGGDGEELS